MYACFQRTQHFLTQMYPGNKARINVQGRKIKKKNLIFVEIEFNNRMVSGKVPKYLEIK